MVKEIPMNTDEGRNGFKVGYVHARLDNLLGKVLTVIDASLLNEQAKAAKDIIRNFFSIEQERVDEMGYKKLRGQNENGGICYEGLFPLTDENRKEYIFE